MIQWINVDRSIVALISMSNESEEDQLNRINLQALQNRDPYITKILDQAQRVCVYKFLADKREWVEDFSRLSKTDLHRHCFS